MSQLVSITSQGQISIPAKIRKNLGLDKYQKALIKREGRKVVIEPVEDIFSLKGALSYKAKKGMTIGQVMKMEEEAWEKDAAKRYRKSVKR